MLSAALDSCHSLPQHQQQTFFFSILYVSGNLENIAMWDNKVFWLFKLFLQRTSEYCVEKQTSHPLTAFG